MGSEHRPQDIHLLRHFNRLYNFHFAHALPLLLVHPNQFRIQNILYFLSGISSFEDHKWVIRINKCIYVYIMATRIIMFLSFLSVLFINSNKLNTAIDIFIGFVGAESVLVIVWVLYGQRFLIKNFERISLADCSQN